MYVKNHFLRAFVGALAFARTLTRDNTAVLIAPELGHTASKISRISSVHAFTIADTIARIRSRDDPDGLNSTDPPREACRKFAYEKFLRASPRALKGMIARM